MITQKEIARGLGLSYMTVSRCLSGKGYVSSETRKRVEDYVKEHNYRPNLIARSLKLEKSNIIGLLVPSFAYSFYPQIIESIQETLKAMGYNLLLCLSSEDPKLEREELETLLAVPVDGILMSPVDSPVAVENCAFLKDSRVPFTLFDRYFNDDQIDCSYVATDSLTASRKLLDYLVECGHRRIAHIGGKPDNSFARLMFEGYKAGLKKNGLEYRPELVHRGHLDESTGAAGIKRLRGAGAKFSAVHTANDPIAIGVLSACRRLNVRIPKDLSVTGFSDIAAAANVYAPLTTVREPAREIGRIAADCIVKQINSDDKSLRIKKLLPGEFVERESCSKIN